MELGVNILGYKMEIRKTKLGLHSEELTGRGGEEGERFRCFLFQGVPPCLYLDIHPSHSPTTRQLSIFICTSPVLCGCVHRYRLPLSGSVSSYWERALKLLCITQPEPTCCLCIPWLHTWISKHSTTGWDRCLGLSQLCAISTPLSIASTFHQRISNHFIFMNWTAEPFCKMSKCYYPHFAQGSRSRDKLRSCL